MTAESVKPRIFEISPKKLISGTSGTSPGELKMGVVKDIIQNFKEIGTGINWVEVLNCLSYGGLKGRRVIYQTFATRLITVAREIGWEMDSPEVVYISGYYFLHPLSNRLKILDSNLERSGERKFRSEEEKTETLKKESEEAGRLGMYRKRLSEALTEYAELHLPHDQKYIETLQRLPYVKPRETKAALDVLRG